MPVGIAGLLIAAIFAATMSTVSSNVNSISTAFTTDIYHHLWPGSSDSRRLRMARISGIVSGGLGIGLALLMAGWNILSLFDYYNIILGLLGGGIAGVFAMAIFFPRINTRGALTGFIMSIIILFFILTYSSVHLLLYGFLGVTISVIIAYIVSLITPGDKKNLAGLTYKSLNK
jgi:Na+/proline symporter